jgi:predicted heme/steroid binding protein
MIFMEDRKIYSAKVFNENSALISERKTDSAKGVITAIAIIVGIALVVSSFFIGKFYSDQANNVILQKYKDQQEKLAADAKSGATSNTGSQTYSSSQSNTSQNATSGSVSTVKQFTLATLKSYNGKGGAKAYVAYSGKIYDVSNSKYFKNGVHIYDSSVIAGTDITTAMNNYAPSSHIARNYMGTLPEVGVLVKVITNSSTGAASSSTGNGSTSNTSSGTSKVTPPVSSQLKQFTLATLKAYNGKNGAKAYIAYEGKIYDVGNSAYFKNGVHTKDSSVVAGTDITTAMNNSAPSSHIARNYIGTLPQVGVLVSVITNSSAGTISGSVTIPPVATMPATSDDDEEEDDD